VQPQVVSMIKLMRLAIAILSQRLVCWTDEREETYFSPGWFKRLSTPIWLFKLSEASLKENKPFYLKKNTLLHILGRIQFKGEVCSFCDTIVAPCGITHKILTFLQVCPTVLQTTPPTMKQPFKLSSEPLPLKSLMSSLVLLFVFNFLTFWASLAPPSNRDHLTKITRPRKFVFISF